MGSPELHGPRAIHLSLCAAQQPGTTQVVGDKPSLSQRSLGGTCKMIAHPEHLLAQPLDLSLANYDMGHVTDGEKSLQSLPYFPTL